MTNPIICKLLRGSRVECTCSSTSCDISNITGVTTAEFESCVILRLSNSELRSITCSNPDKLVNIKCLDLSHNAIDNVPSLRLPNLIKLDLSYNNISTVQDNINATTLDILDLSHNAIVNLPSLSLPKLSRLFLSYNKISTVHDNIKPTTLTYLDVSHNLITTVKVISSLPNLIELYLQNNIITSVIIKSTTLTYLDVSYNKLASLDSRLNQYLPQLTSIVLSCQTPDSIDVTCVAIPYFYSCIDNAWLEQQGKSCDLSL